jgi:poly-gamma-glutamate synthesis protein (capsule biosynthesis protein)
MSFDILICGDFYVGPHAGGRLGAVIDQKNYHQLFGDLFEDLKSASLSIINLEGPILESARASIKTGPAISMKPTILNALKEANINLVTLANNHIMDFGLNGISETLTSLNHFQINFVGAGLNKNEISKPYFSSIRSKKIAVINVCEHEWISDFHSDAGANGIDLIELHRQIQECKKNADFTFVVYHGGIEYHPLPTPQIQKVFRFMIDAGASVVLSHHTHTFSGYEVYKGCPIFYSLGNFIFDSNKKSKGENWNKGFSVGFNILNNSLNFEIIPFTQNKNEIGLKKMKDIELKEFNDKINSYNFIIEDDTKLAKAYDEFVKRMSVQYMAFINPYEGKLSSLFKRGLLPSLFTKNKKLLILNLLRCESHKELFERILLMEVTKNNR